jgi:hypothetical protein
MSVETCGDDPGGLGDFPEAQAAEAPPTLHQPSCCIEQGVAGLLFLFGAGQHAVGDI